MTQYKITKAVDENNDTLIQKCECSGEFEYKECDKLLQRVSDTLKSLISEFKGVSCELTVTLNLK